MTYNECKVMSVCYSIASFILEGITLWFDKLTNTGRYVTPLPVGRSRCSHVGRQRDCNETASRWSAWFHIADAVQSYRFNKHLLTLNSNSNSITNLDPGINIQKVHRNIFALLMLFWSLSVNSQELQDTDLRSKMSSLFEEGASIDWVKQFSGFKNNLFPFTMTLGKSGEEVKGWYYYHPEELFYVSGAWNGKNLWLDEWYKEGEECGHFVGQFDENSFSGTWSNIEKNMMSSCTFSESTSEVSKPTKKASIIQFYTEQDDALQGKWTIWTDQEGIFQGTFINRQRSLFQVRLIRLKKNESGKPSFKVACIGEDFQIAHTIWIEPWNKSWYFPDKPEVIYKVAKFKVLQESPIDIKIDFHWMVAHTPIEYVEKYTSTLAIYKDTTCNLVGRKRLSPEFRSNQYRSSTFLPLIYDKTEVSGLLTVQSVSTLNTCSSTLPISFKDKQEKDPLDGIVDKEDFNKAFQAHVQNQLSSIKQNHPNPYLKDIKSEEFKHFLLFEGGLLAARAFDGLHGVLWIRVPDRLIDTYFDKKSLAYKYSTSKI